MATETVTAARQASDKLSDALGQLHDVRALLGSIVQRIEGHELGATDDLGAVARLALLADREVKAAIATVDECALPQAWGLQP